MTRSLPLWRVLAFLACCFIAGAGITFALLRNDKEQAATPSAPAPLTAPAPVSAPSPQSVDLPAQDPEEVARRYVRYSTAYRLGDSAKRWRRRLEALMTRDGRQGRVDPPRPGSEVDSSKVVGTDLRFRTDIDAEVIVTYAFRRAGQARETYTDIALVLERRGRRWLVDKATALGE